MCYGTYLVQVYVDSYMSWSVKESFKYIWNLTNIVIEEDHMHFWLELSFIMMLFTLISWPIYWNLIQLSLICLSFTMFSSIITYKCKKSLIHHFLCVIAFSAHFNSPSSPSPDSEFCTRFNVIFLIRFLVCFILAFYFSPVPWIPAHEKTMNMIVFK